MDVSPDFADLFRILNKYKVRYLIVGAYAAIYYTEPRYTKDIDIWVDSNIDNAERVYKALKEFGAPLRGVKAEDFTNPRQFYQIGIAPVRVDVMTGLKGMQFNRAWKNRKKSKYGRVPINIMSLKDLITSKETSRRDSDLKDVQKLRRRAKTPPVV